jgi:hypothetical protein
MLSVAGTHRPRRRGIYIIALTRQSFIFVFYTYYFYLYTYAHTYIFYFWPTRDRFFYSIQQITSHYVRRTTRRPGGGILYFYFVFIIIIIFSPPPPLILLPIIPPRGCLTVCPLSNAPPQYINARIIYLRMGLVFYTIIAASGFDHLGPRPFITTFM